MKCGSLPDTETCLGGVFMENMQRHLVQSEDALVEDLPDICRDVIAINNATHTRSCFESIGEGLMFFTGHDMRKSLRLCDRVADGYWDVCKL